MNREVLKEDIEDLEMALPETFRAVFDRNFDDLKKHSFDRIGFDDERVISVVKEISFNFYKEGFVLGLRDAAHCITKLSDVFGK